MNLWQLWRRTMSITSLESEYCFFIWIECESITGKPLPLSHPSPHPTPTFCQIFLAVSPVSIYTPGSSEALWELSVSFKITLAQPRLGSRPIDLTSGPFGSDDTRPLRFPPGYCPVEINLRFPGWMAMISKKQFLWEQKCTRRELKSKATWTALMWLTINCFQTFGESVSSLLWPRRIHVTP